MSAKRNLIQLTSVRTSCGSWGYALICHIDGHRDWSLGEAEWNFPRMSIFGVWTEWVGGQQWFATLLMEANFSRVNIWRDIFEEQETSPQTGKSTTLGGFGDANYESIFLDVKHTWNQTWAKWCQSHKPRFLGFEFGDSWVKRGQRAPRARNNMVVYSRNEFFVTLNNREILAWLGKFFLDIWTRSIWTCAFGYL